MKSYQAVLFAPDGEWVTDHHGCETVQEVQERLANQGSRWIFYPYTFVILDHSGDRSGFTTDRQRIIDAPDEMRGLVGYSIKTAGKLIASLSEDEHRFYLGGY
jgi:hypothetical protein